jgi:hypothetical protein
MGARLSCFAPEVRSGVIFPVNPRPPAGVSFFLLGRAFKNAEALIWVCHDLSVLEEGSLASSFEYAPNSKRLVDDTC